MRKRVFWVFALAFCAACTEAGLRQSQLTLGGTPQRVAGTGNLSQPKFAGGSGSFLAITDGGQPRMVFVVSAITLEVEPVSFRPPPPGVPATPSAIGEIVRDALVIPNDDSSSGSVSGTATRAAFLSQASNLLDPGSGVFFLRDSTQAFVKDLATGTNYLASAAADGQPADADVTSVVLCGSGRFVAFATRATNLYVPVNPSQAPNGAAQIYVLDLQTGVLQLISADPDGKPGTGDSTDIAISTDGRFVAFRSKATNLVDGDTNMTADIFVYDRQKMTMDRASVSSAGTQTYVDAAEPAVSQDGNIVAFSASQVSGGPRQVFVRDRAAGTTTLLSANPAPGDADSSSPSMTPDGQHVAFASMATNLGGFPDPLDVSDVFVVDRMTSVLTQVSLDVEGTANGDGDSTQPSLSPDGSFLAYISTASNVAEDNPDRPNGDANGLANLILAPLQ
jgi:Tol biopolymer transport system component